MKVLMFGWEFPPIYSGGLGTLCHGLTKGLSEKGIDVTFVMPSAPEGFQSHVKILGTNNITKNIKIKKVDSILAPYSTFQSYSEQFNKINVMGTSKSKNPYGKNLFEEEYRFSQVAKVLAEEEDHDVIHCHDWMTFRAGMNAKEISGKPLVVHVHATEFDRTGGNGVNQHVYDIERQGMHNADLVVTVSNYVKDNVMRHYGVDPSKIRVVHNAINLENVVSDNSHFKMNKNDKLVLFLGRITLQKGPEYFIDAAKKVLEKKQNVKFIMAGDGDMLPRMIERAAWHGISKNIMFTGFLTGHDIDKAYRMADLYVMPSVSEPFGLTPLEALRNGTPVLISKTSGVSEKLVNALKVDFWDVNDMANKMLAALNYNSLHATLKENGMGELKKFNWNDAANNIIDVYNEAMKMSRPIQLH